MDGSGGRCICSSTPNQKRKIDPNSPTVSSAFELSDGGYYSATTCSPWCVGESARRSSDLPHSVGRQSYRGKRRLDIVSVLMDFDHTGYLLERILGYIPVCDRITLLSVSTNWYKLKKKFPNLFLMKPKSNDPEEKENYMSWTSRDTPCARVPLSGVNSRTVQERQLPVAQSLVQESSEVVMEREDLHPCPICSGPAHYRPSEWPNRLHCQSTSCGISVCYVCRREHSPSDRCSVRSPRPRLRMPSPESDPHSAPTRRRLNKLALRRL
ncbi:unnamed protein product [Dicrocoelium dendriticum]|nr:unnamed protein product [Dicrocoelium dendriticum]